MNIDQYEARGHALYERLAEVVAEMLRTALSQQLELRLQHIQLRAKAVPSLRRKLDRAGALQTDNIAAVAKDLAGCRDVGEVDELGVGERQLGKEGGDLLA